MKKYLGSYITAFGAIVYPLFICFLVLFSAYLLSCGISEVSVFITFLSVANVLFAILFIKINCNQFYSWGKFASKSVKITTLFSKSSTMVYEKCKSCGIGFYVHGTLNSKAGSTIYFIFLSYDLFDESFRWNMNSWKPSQTRIKMQFSKKLYDYLLTVLPIDLSQMLRRDYEMLFGQKKIFSTSFSPKKR